ncbi:EAL domain-containing protein [Herbaspirillum lusitanum]|uniref:EAL domain-containing protein n=1 Tax=Herbaspirillum lusitanum TaxID=213312 RepID=UPI00223912C6|nr:EAL domain-containing protein [Herbaspirillum lusitanum]MCW5297433.1 EAL domain-containing protein [Herbaspirillum lusitanum]
MAKDLDHRIVAEGVDAEEIMGLVKEWSCDEVQGCFFARPVAAEEFFSYLN